MMPILSQNKKLTAAAGLLLVLAASLYLWRTFGGAQESPHFISGNGRVEATEIDIAAKLAGRIDEILVDEGAFVSTGQLLARMQVQSLEAQRDEAVAYTAQSAAAVDSAQALMAARVSDFEAARAVAAQRESELDAAGRRLARSQELVLEGASSQQEVDDDRARVAGIQAALQAAKAQMAAARAAVNAAQNQVTGARATVRASQATARRIEVDIRDSSLTAPRGGRIQYRIAQPGEVVPAGGKVLNLVDLSDVYMTFFVPETSAGKLALGAEVRIILDAAPQYVLPARISYVASNAQFTPKTVETASERQKLMFRVKAQLDRDLLLKHLQLVKTGLPGVAWVRMDERAAWPANLALKVPQ